MCESVLFDLVLLNIRKLYAYISGSQIPSIRSKLQPVSLLKYGLAC